MADAKCLACLKLSLGQRVITLVKYLNLKSNLLDRLIYITIHTEINQSTTISQVCISLIYLKIQKSKECFQISLKYIRRAIRKAGCWEAQRSGPPKHQALKALGSHVIKNHYSEIFTAPRDVSFEVSVHGLTGSISVVSVSHEKASGHSSCVSSKGTHSAPPPRGNQPLYSVCSIMEASKDASPTFVEEKYN